MRIIYSRLRHVNKCRLTTSESLQSRLSLRINDEGNPFGITPIRYGLVGREGRTVAIILETNQF